MFIDFADFSSKERSEYWHFKIQKFVLGKVPYQDNFCPYFWLTILSIILFLPLFFIKVILYRIIIKIVLKSVFQVLYAIVEFIFDLLDKGIDKLICDPYYNYYSEHMDNKKVYETYTKVTSFDSFSSSSENKSVIRANVLFDNWKSKAGENWKEKLDVIIQEIEQKETEQRKILAQWREEKRQRDLERQKKAEAFEKKVKKTYGIIIRITKIVAPIIGVILAIGLIYLIVMFFIWVVPIVIDAFISVPWGIIGEAILFILKWIGIILAGLIPFVLLGFGFYKLGCLIRQRGECILCRRIGNILRPIGRFFGFIFKGIGRQFVKFGYWIYPLFPGIGNIVVTIATAICDVFKFFWSGFMGWKKENCPPIKWKDSNF